MALAADWVRAAADEIARTPTCVWRTSGGYGIDKAAVAQIIEKHCPFKRGVAYEPISVSDLGGG